MILNFIMERATFENIITYLWKMFVSGIIEALPASATRYRRVQERAGSHQSISQWSKIRTSIADPGSASSGTFQYMHFLPFFLTCSI